MYYVRLSKVSHSIDMLSIQIDTKNIDHSLVQQHRIVLICKQYKASSPLVIKAFSINLNAQHVDGLTRFVWLFDTLE